MSTEAARVAGERSSCTLGPGSPNHSLFTSFLDGASPVSRRKQLEISDILRVSGLPADPRKKVDQKLARWEMLTTLFDGTAAGGALRIPPLLSSSTVTVERLIGERTEGESSRSKNCWSGERVDMGGQRVTLQRVRGSESGEGRREKSEMKRACRIALFKPNKICGITSQICRMVDARTFLLYICRRGNDEEGEDGCMCMRVYVYMCVCVRGEKKERCLQPMDRGEGMTCGSNRDWSERMHREMRLRTASQPCNDLSA